MMETNNVKEILERRFGICNFFWSIRYSKNCNSHIWFYLGLLNLMFMQCRRCIDFGSTLFGYSKDFFAGASQSHIWSTLLDQRSIYCRSWGNPGLVTQQEHFLLATTKKACSNGRKFEHSIKVSKDSRLYTPEHGWKEVTRSILNSPPPLLVSSAFCGCKAHPSYNTKWSTLL